MTEHDDAWLRLEIDRFVLDWVRRFGGDPRRERRPAESAGRTRLEAEVDALSDALGQAATELGIKGFSTEAAMIRLAGRLEAEQVRCRRGSRSWRIFGWGAAQALSRAGDAEAPLPVLRKDLVPRRAWVVVPVLVAAAGVALVLRTPPRVEDLAKGDPRGTLEVHVCHPLDTPVVIQGATSGVLVARSEDNAPFQLEPALPEAGGTLRVPAGRAGSRVRLLLVAGPVAPPAPLPSTEGVWETWIAASGSSARWLEWEVCR